MRFRINPQTRVQSRGSYTSGLLFWGWSRHAQRQSVRESHQKWLECSGYGESHQWQSTCAPNEVSSRELRSFLRGHRHPHGFVRPGPPGDVQEALTNNCARRWLFHATQPFHLLVKVTLISGFSPPPCLHNRITRNSGPDHRTQSGSLVSIHRDECQKSIVVIAFE